MQGLANVSERVLSLLRDRGIREESDISAFLSPQYESLHDPVLLHDMNRAVARLLSAVRAKERIAVYADFDCDGIPGAALLYDVFKKIGYEHVEVYIPHRDREGYGFHAEAVRDLALRGVSLIITVDVGMSAIESVALAKSLGVDTIVTDHHEQTQSLPPACAVVNPKLSGYPFPHLCGAAVAWKLGCAFLAEGKKKGMSGFDVPEGWEKWLLDMVALATIADLVPLVGENRVLAHYGLRVLRKTKRAGLRALAAHQRLALATLTEDDIGFVIAPRLNAASRMGEPESAFRLLTTPDSAEAEMLAMHLEELNAKRKTVVSTIVREARKRVKNRFSSEPVVVLGDSAWKPALLGLAANSLMEDRGGVVCLWGRDSAGRLKGSCRSDGALSVVDLFSAAKSAFEEYGGHAASGGFSVSHEAVHTLQETLLSVAKELPRGSGKEERAPDIAVSLSEITPALFRELALLAPFGMGNPKPLIAVKDVSVSSLRQFGRDRNHLEVMLSCSRSGVSCRSFDFFRSSSSFSYAPEVGRPVEILGTLERDAYRGPERLALRLVDILASR
jgi:single-stranded-DNA-specific exonuclease